MSATRSITADIGREYSLALSHYLRSGAEVSIREAYQLGRRALLIERRSLLEMVNLHHAALARISREDSPRGLPAEAITKAGAFFAECMASFEMTQRAIAESNAAQRKMNKVHEEEVRRIALALHDDAGQLMVAAHMSLDEAMRDLPPATQERLREVKVLLSLVGERIRRLSHELHPAMLEILGLVPALEFLAANVAKRTGLRITVESALNLRPPPQMAITFYRIVQETLTNVQRHAHASTVRIRLRKDGAAVQCSITDDGKGFNPEKVMHSGLSGLGLVGIQERLNALGGKLRIYSAEGRGTTLEITAPLMELEYADTGIARG
ncbi:MAG: ATP-binding protein [Terracidiphilus sp.]|jgi:signal transduction histidine kinase